MASVFEAADREYAIIQSGHALKRTFTVAGAQGDFDFLTSAEAKAAPVHIVEIRREEARRAKAGFGPSDLTREEFAQRLGISVADTADPVSGISVLTVSEAMRAYYGDPQDEAYRALRRHLVRFGDNQDWLKQSSFTNPTLDLEVDRMHQVEQWEKTQHDAKAQARDLEAAPPVATAGVDATASATPSTESVRQSQRISSSSSPAAPTEPLVSGRARASNMAANYRKKMQDDFNARKEL